MGVTYIEGQSAKKIKKIGIVVSRWNSMITEKLLGGAVSALRGNGISEEQILVVRCPGSFEIPLTCQLLLEHKDIDGIVALGVVIRGGTPHFEYVCEAVTKGVVEVNLKYNKPVAFGVLTTDNVQQALDRAGDDGNKGAEAALALMEMISMYQKLS